MPNDDSWSDTSPPMNDIMDTMNSANAEGPSGFIQKFIDTHSNLSRPSIWNTLSNAGYELDETAPGASPYFESTSHNEGISAYLDDAFPGFYNSLFVTLWSAFPEGQRIVWFGPGGEETATFATGFAAPIDLTVGPDGALYVADWATGIIFRIAYGG